MSRFRAVVAAFVVAVAVLLGACGSSSPAPKTPTTVDGLAPIGAGLRGPTGLVATAAATGLPKVSALAFDDAGRLWAATADFADSGTDGVYVVTSVGAPPVQVVRDVHTPLGLLWHGGELFVASKERVDAYTAFDGTAFASSRTVVAFPTGIGEVNGLALGPDGRIRVGISAPCDSCVPDDPMSGAVVSFLPDGTDRRVDASGIRAPIGLAYFPGTGDLFVSMNQRDDLRDATPGDWLALVSPGQHWGFPACYGQGGTACDDVPAPVAALDRHAAVSGVALVTGGLGPGVGDAAVVAEWAAKKVLMVQLRRTAGGSYAGTVRPFLTGLEHPVPVVTAADGSLLVGDWGTGEVYRVATR